jgi:NADPH:quinone reductase-like Zn-dependent oxidoreductase
VKFFNILTNGAGASVGTLAVQIAKSYGAQVRAVEQGMRRSDVSEFKSVQQTQRFLNTHVAAYK